MLFQRKKETARDDVSHESVDQEPSASLPESSKEPPADADVRRDSSDRENGESRSGIPDEGVESETLESASRETDVAPGELSRIEAKLDNIDQILRSRILQDSVKEQMFNALHARLTAAESDTDKKVKLPLVRGIIKACDTLEWYAANPPGSDETVRMLNDVLEELLDVLDTEGVRKMTPEAMEFDPETQQSLRVELTAKDELHGKVAEVLKPGYWWEQRVIRPQSVVVYRKQEGGEL